MGEENENIRLMEEEGAERDGDKEVDILNNDDTIPPIQSGSAIFSLEGVGM